MKFQIDTKTLKNALDIVNHATASISTTPILENILLKVNYNNIILTSNNLEMAIEHVVNENLEISLEWSFCIPSKIFTNYISLLSDDIVHIELLNDNSIEIKSQTSQIKIKWTDAWDFPLIPNVKEDLVFNLNSNVIKKSIEKTLFSSAEWNIRPTLAWIYVNLDWNKAKFATTDSFRLSEFKVDLNNSLENSFSQIIPSKTAFELKSILWDIENVKLVAWENQLLFIIWNTKFYSRVLNGKFPDYSWFFPNSYNTKAIVNRIDLIQALKKINLLSRENNYSIKVSFSNETWILIETSETQVWEAKVYLVGSIEWEDSIIWLNSEYFLEALWVIDTTHISISFESPLSPILIKWVNDWDKPSKDDFRHIIMPLKI